MRSISLAVGHLARVVDLDHLARRRCARRYSTDGAVAMRLEVELALEPLADDLHVQQPEEAAAEAEAERAGRLRLVGEAASR